jgi:Transposase DDE domain group 1
MTETVRKSGLDTAISMALAPWRSRGPYMIPARSCWISRSLQCAGTAWPMSACCGPNHRCSGRWPPIRRSPPHRHLRRVRAERPHPGAQLRITDADGHRLTCFATNTTSVPIAALELRHRQRARAEDRIRAARATGLRNLPLNKSAQNQIWLEIVQLALDLLAWMPMLDLTGPARLWEPRRLRLRLFSAAAQLVITTRRRHLKFTQHWPWTDVITDAIERLQLLPNPG